MESKILILLIFVAAGAYCGEVPKISIRPYIIGGTESFQLNRPYQVSLVSTDGSNDFICGGSIINERWILTAAHCLTDMEMIIVRAGSLYMLAGGWSSKTSTYYTHPKYDADSHVYDVGVVYVHEPIPLDGCTMKIVKLARIPVPPGIPVTVSGWGSTEEGGSASQALMEVNLVTMDDRKCQEIYHVASRSMMCVGGYVPGMDSCQGDSGSPLVLEDNTQVGIVSYGLGCGRIGTPAIYANVAHLRDWILEVTKI